MNQLSLFDCKEESKPLKQWEVFQIKHETCDSFCNVWHYSKSCPNGVFYFGIYDNGILKGVICYGEPAMRNQKDCYSAILELRRLCCIDETPKNTESYFIGKTLRELRKLKVSGRIISLADPNHGHKGTIYKASNFKLLGLELGGGSRNVFVNGEKMHSRTAFQRYGGSGLKSLKNALPDADVKIEDTERKIVYAYDL